MGRVLCCWRGTGGLVLCWKGMGGKVLCCWRDTGAGSCAAGGVRGQGPVLLERCGGRVLCCWRSMGAGSCAVGGVWGQGPVFLGCSLLLLACNCGRSRHAHPYQPDCPVLHIWCCCCPCCSCYCCCCCCCCCCLRTLATVMSLHAITHYDVL